MNKQEYDEVKSLAKNIRLKTLDLINNAHASHIASAFSIADILAVLYGGVLDVSPETFCDDNRDRLILSKGHAAAALYSALYFKGFISESDIENYYKNGAKLGGHVSHKGVRGVEVSTGSLGHGACLACGIALANKLNNTDARTFVILGDGECNEGCVWEMALFAAQQKLGNLTVIVDRNNFQAMGRTETIIKNDNLEARWKSCGFETAVVDGHDIEALTDAFQASKKSLYPTCIIADTVKGKGVSFMENNILWHYRDPQGELYQQAKTELTYEKTTD